VQQHGLHLQFSDALTMFNFGLKPRLVRHIHPIDQDPCSLRRDFNPTHTQTLSTTAQTAHIEYLPTLELLVFCFLQPQSYI